MQGLQVLYSNAKPLGATGANADSSRSHAILQIVLKHRNAKNRIQGSCLWLII